MIKGEKNEKGGRREEEEREREREREREKEEWTLREIGKRGNLLLRHLERDEGRIESRGFLFLKRRFAALVSARLHIFKRPR